MLDARTGAPAAIQMALPSIELAPGTAVIADLHLDVLDPGQTAGFVRWLESQAERPRLVILGDLFDVWVGPAQARAPGAPRVLDALSELSARRTAIDLVPGNRDFLLDRSFETRTGVRLHPEGFVGLVRGERWLFVHGDTLCTRDAGYQRLRRVLRSRPVAWIAPRIPLAIGARVARRLRRASVSAVARKPTDEKAIQPDAVARLAREQGCSTLVCGHAHAFQDVRLPSRGADVRWIVLDAFGGTRDLLDLDADAGFCARASGSAGAG